MLLAWEKGFIYLIFNFFIQLFFKFNIVEWFKYLFKTVLISKKSTQKDQAIVRRLAVDIFIILKFILLLFAFSFPSDVLLYIAYYLCFTNIFTYFYYHVWDVTSGLDIDSRRRRFVNLFLSLLFNISVFALIYKDVGVQLKISGDFGYLLLSLANNFMLSFEGIYSQADQDWTYKFIAMTHALTSFGFLTIILSNTVIGENNDRLQK